ncbi:hypothetical protein E2562_018132 [Oryza meyeriana var. granulata]|uniref:Uncharacterized protein n=1 Tax=Oryza meyeriana var. granulata TaxID=110450 RepID=A0A6G1C6A3_9ORYZ|nr:hypothetical protein E2562_018132 [Oryza meyeriana var. granulata]
MESSAVAVATSSTALTGDLTGDQNRSRDSASLSGRWSNKKPAGTERTNEPSEGQPSVSDQCRPARGAGHGWGRPRRSVDIMRHYHRHTRVAMEPFGVELNDP